MHIYFDESIHDQAGFMLVAFVVCKNDPQEELLDILNQYELDEYHSCTNMSACKEMQALREDFRSYINHKCKWGIMILPNTSRRCFIDELKKTIVRLQNKMDISSISFDEGLINQTQAENLKNDLSISNITVNSSHLVLGIQLSDLVAALCGVRLRSEIMDTHKMLTYGEEHGYEPPIEASLAWELWATLRYSMLYHYHDIFEGEDMPEFDTKGIGCFISQECNSDLVEKAEKLFASVYLGCIH